MISDSNPTPNEHRNGCGQLLRQAREAAGMALEDVATRLHMPVQVVRALEQEDWAKLGAPVFVRGQLRGYARLMKVDLEPLLQSEPVTRIEPAELVSHTHTPRLRRLAESTARRAVYVVMTGVLAIPVWYATRGHLDGHSPSTASLDEVPPPARVKATPPPAPAQVALADAEPRRPVAAPYIASMAPVPRTVLQDAATLQFKFNGDSWVQILAPDGATVEKALIKAGEQRQYSAGQVGRVVLGNASAVEVQQSGGIVDMKPYQRANVARFAVSSDGSVVPASE